MFLEDALEETGFWLLAGGGITAVLIGWIVSKNMMEFSFPFWQLAIVMVGIIVASAFFATKD